MAARVQAQVDEWRARQAQTGQNAGSNFGELPAPERPLALAHLEQINKASGDLEILREIKAYKRLNGQPSTKPPESA